MRLLGKPAAAGRVARRGDGCRLTAEVEALPRGFRVCGTVAGRVGRIEAFRAPAPRRFLLNNWQSWGPCQALDRGATLVGVAERMESYSRWVFTPIPEVFRGSVVSDYFIAWEDTLVGFLSSRVAHPYFVIEGDEVAGYWEYFGTDLADPVRLEPLVVLSGAPVEKLLEAYADLTAADAGIRVPGPNPVGWSSWYQYFTNLTGPDLEKNLRLAGRGFPFEVFQIDDGYEADIGDWLEVKADFPNPRDLARRIRERGFTAGIWTAPFSAAETSALFARHPDWFVAENGRPKPCYRGWGKTIYALDTTHPQARDWLGGIFRTFAAMGYSYFKIDFLFAAAMTGERHVPVSPIQAYRLGMDIVREAAGGGFVLACGAPLLPSLGFCQGMRVGEDTAPFWDPRRSGLQGPNAYIALKNPILRWFMHRRWWLNDPDCLLLREKDIQLTFEEKALYARSAGLLDSMLIESDDLELVDVRGRDLLREAVSLKGGRPTVRGVLDDDFYILETAGGPAGRRRFAANLSEGERIVEGRTVGPRSGIFLL
jgi:alpha-galactosidase